MVLTGGCAQLQAMVHGVTTEECQAALQSHSWSVQRAAQYLKVPLLPARPGMRGPESWLCPVPHSVLVPLAPVCLMASPCPSGGAALWAGSSAAGGVPQSPRDVRLEPRASRLPPSGFLWARPPQVSDRHSALPPSPRKAASPGRGLLTSKEGHM